MSAGQGRRTVLLEELTSAEFSRLVERKPLVIVPFGSTEEHGSHLPLCTDSFQAEAVARRLAEEFDAVLCPPVRYGLCKLTRNFPGTISLSFDTVRALAFELVSELARNGIDKVLLLSGHAGREHMSALREGALKAVEAYEHVTVMVLSDYELAYELRGKEFSPEDGHAGEIETSRMLHVRPELVGRARPSGRARPPSFMVVKHPERYFPTGVLGDARKASAAKGLRIEEYVVARLAELVESSFGMKRRVSV